jgi:hypothetical protein
MARCQYSRRESNNPKITMMKSLGMIILIFTLLNCCAGSRAVTNTTQSDSSYLVTAIDSINNWYTIYATRGDSVYKIVAKKDPQNLGCKRTITIGQSYNLVLHSRKNETPEINGVKVKPVNSLDVQCYTYDENTNICIEQKKGIFDLYHTPNIKGLCYIN